MTDTTRVLTEQIPGPRGYTGATGATGAQGGPGVDAIVKPVTTASVLAHAAQTDPGVPGSVRAADTFTTKPFSGVFTASQIAGLSQAIQHAGPIYPADYNLGAGSSCAVGCDANGVLVRVTDPTCVSGINYIGWCDVAGTITVAPRMADKISVLDWGLDPTGLTSNDARLATLFSRIDTTKCQQQVVFFPAGIYRFDSPWPAIPVGTWIVGAGTGVSYYPRFYTGAGTVLAFFGSGTGLRFQSAGVASNASHRGGLLDLCVVSGNSNGASNYPSIAECAVEIIGDAHITIARCRFGGFKYSISVDGGEGIWMSQLNFDAGQFTIVQADGTTWTSYTGYADLNTDRDAVTVALTGATTVEFIASTRTLRRSTGSWFADGFKPGLSFPVTGTTLNNATLTALVVSDLDMTVVDDGVVVIQNETATPTISTIAFDSATAIRIGEWRFSVPGSANGVYLDRAQFNNCRWGTWHKGGVGHYINSGNYELGGGYAVIDGGNQISFTQLAGEGYGTIGKGGIWIRPNAGVVGLKTDNCFFGRSRPAIFSEGSVYNLTFTANSCYATTSKDTLGLVQSTSWAGGTLTVTTTAPHSVRSGEPVYVEGIAASPFTATATVTGASNITVPLAIDPGAYAGGGVIRSAGYYPLDGPGYWNDISQFGNILPPDRPVLCASYSGPSGYSGNGLAVNHSTMVRAALDVAILNYSTPVHLFRSQDHHLFESRATAYNGGRNETIRRVYSTGSGMPGASRGDAIQWADVAAAAGSALVLTLPAQNQLGGVVVVDAVGNDYSNSGHVVRYRITQGFYREDGGTAAIVLVGSPIVETLFLNGSAFPTPTLSVVGHGVSLPAASDVGIGVSVAGHATDRVLWAIMAEYIAGGR